MPAIAFVPERIAEWSYWIVEREKVRKARESGKAPPYTKDPVLANNRYCNVRRLDDKVSKWLLENWYTPGRYADCRTALLAALLARMINKPETLTAIIGNNRGFRKWDYDRAYKAMYEIKNRGGIVFTNAYIINGASGGPKIDQVLNAIDQCASRSRDKQASRFIVADSLQRTAESLHSLPGVGSFIAGQVVADLRWVIGNETWWLDRMTWAPPGPGSSRGMKYLLGQATPQDMAGRGNDMREREFLPALRALVELAKKHKQVGPVFKDRKLEAHDIQNTLCETSKYVRIKYGTGKAKNGYDAMARYNASQLELDI